MAEVTAMRNNSTDYPVYGLPWSIVFPMLDADGDLVKGATTPDAEISLNGDTFADCTNESTEIATSSGIYYLTLTAAEMTADIVAIIAKSATTGMKTTPFVMYPKKLPLLLTSDNAGEYNSTTTINLGSSASAIDDFYNGCIVYVYGGTGNGQVRKITDYVGSTKLATVHVAWATNPDATSDLKVYRTELAPWVLGANITAVGGTAQTARDIGASVLLSSGTGSGQISLSSGLVALQSAQKVDVDTIKTQAVTCAAGVTVLAQVGAAGAPGAANGLVTTNGTKVNQTVDLTAGQSIACSDKTGFSLAATGADLILKSSTFIQAIVAAVNEFATYGLTALNTLLVTTGIKVGSIANNAITANAINDGAITNAKVADDVDVNAKTVTAGVIAADVWNAATSGYGGAGTYGQAVEDILADTNELQVDDTPTAVAAVKTVVDAVKVQTDKLTFTVANQVDANIQYINDTAVTGDGGTTPWGPA